MKNEPETRRKFTRIHFDRQVKLEFIDDSFYSEVKNLSLTGMFIIGNFQKLESKYCLIDLYQTKKSANFSLRASAKVVRNNDKGIAVQFISMPLDSCKFLQSTLPKPEDFPFKITGDLDLATSPETNIQFNN